MYLNIILHVTLFMFVYSNYTENLNKIKTNGQFFVDQENRTILLHGFNSVFKSFPWIPNANANQNLSNQTILSLYRKWGINVIRLGYMWSGLFPEKGKLNQTYVDEMEKIIDTLESYGMYVIIDLHQDMMSSKFGSYDGIPRWVIDEMPTSKHEFPWPFKNITHDSFTAYLTESCGFAFQCLYDNISNSETYFHEYWSTIAKIFKNKSSILAYELINEPWAGDIYENPLRLLPGFADKFNLLKLYDNAYQVIRNYDKNTLIMYEPVTWGLMSPSDSLGIGFDHSPGFDSKSTVLSWHYYCWITNNFDPLINDTLPDFVSTFCDKWQLSTYFSVVQNETKKLGGSASFLTEFGYCAFVEKDTGKYNIEMCDFILNECDQNFQSWTYESTEQFLNDDLEINNQILNLFSRVYPMATNGIPLNLYYNYSTKDFRYVFSFNITSLRQAKLATEIFIPAFSYPNGFIITVSNNIKWMYYPDNYKLLIYLNDEIIEKFDFDQKFFYESVAFIVFVPKFK